MAAVPLCHLKSGVTVVTIIMPLSFTSTLTSIGSPVALLLFSCKKEDNSAFVSWTEVSVQGMSLVVGGHASL